MQASLCNVALPHLAFSKAIPNPRSSPNSIIVPSKARTVVAMASPRDFAAVNYNSNFSVFPAEACETIGGEACLADIYPEVRINQDASGINVAIKSEESVEREYLDYTSAKTVFPAEACDDLGGEFCERPYQRGVY